LVHSFPTTGKTSVKQYREDVGACIQRLEDREFYLIVDLYGRVHTNITSLPAALRCCLSCNGKPLVSIDLKNSQPLMMGIVSRRYFAGKNMPQKYLRMMFDKRQDTYAYRSLPSMEKRSLPDVEELLDLCQSGQLYESFNHANVERSKFKAKFFTEVMFGKNRIKSAVKNAFSAKFPNVAGMLERLKTPDHSRAAKIMQNLEATIFIHNICGRLLRECPEMFLLTIHDSVLLVAGETNKVKEVIADEFKRFGIEPPL